MPWAKANAEGDHNLRSKKIAWTILRPTGIMQNFLESAHALSKGVLPYTTGVGGESRLDRGNPREPGLIHAIRGSLGDDDGVSDPPDNCLT